MSTKQDVSFGNPAAILAPDLVVEQQRWQRQQDLIDALRARSLQPIDPGRGSVSWTQGLSQLLGALAAKKMQRTNDDRMIAMNRGYAERMGGMFGLNRTPAQPAAQPPIQLKPETQAMLTPEAKAGLEAVNAQPANLQQSFDQAFDAPPAMQPQDSSYPMSLSGNPQRDYYDYTMNPQAYTEAMVKAHAPVDFARQLEQSGISPNSPLGRQIMQAQLAKQNYIAPVTGRPGSTIRDPNDPSKILGYDAPNIDGAVPVYGENGMPTGYKQLPGSTQAIAAAAGARTAGQNANEPISGYDAQGNPVFGSKLDAAHGGSANFRPGVPLGAAAAADVQGKASAEAYNQIASVASGAPDRIFSLRQIKELVSNPNTILGPGSTSVNRLSGVFGTLGQKVGLSAPQSVTNAGELNKWFAQYGARQAESLGLGGSDSRFQVAVHASPNGEMTPQAIKNVLPTFVGWEVAAKDRGLMAQRYQQTYGLQSAQSFQTAWSQAYDPRIYTWMAEGGINAVKSHVTKLPAAERKQLLGKYDAMRALGATFSE